MTNKIKTLLIANRGEIACRIIKTAKQLGITTIAVYSDADKNALHVHMADAVFHIGASPARDSYLNIDRIIDTAKKAGCDAIHPGYGFLSQNSEFAKRCQNENIIFVGAPIEAMRLMGDKSSAKDTAMQAGVPVTPGYTGASQDTLTLASEAKKIGFPLMIKASLGGGGKGMRLVHQASEFEEALAGAQREGKASFGSDHVIVEKYIENPRHIEIQIFGDTHGNIVHLFERDCSIQRRHQKILEESPAGQIPAALLQNMYTAATRLAQHIGYVGAGTLEFLVSGNEFYFMEMNTRLQVEHPVTELITGLDLVKWQLLVAEGHPLPLSQDKIKRHGHAIEARLYAEDPAQNFLPSIGTLRILELPASPNLRIDTGVRTQDTVTPYYDPMIAKLIAWGETRAQALGTLQNALLDSCITGITTNRALLLHILLEKDFQAGLLDTHYLEKHPSLLNCPPNSMALSLAAALELHTTLAEDASNPWLYPAGWRLFGHSKAPVQFHQQQTLWVTLLAPAIYKVETTGDVIKVVRQNAHHWQLLVNEHSLELMAFTDNFQWHLFWQDEVACVERHQGFDFLHSKEDSLSAPMPGTITAVMVNVGDSVEAGQTLLVLEAMKMEHAIKAPHAGHVKTLPHRVGDVVSEGIVLVELE